MSKEFICIIGLPKRDSIYFSLDFSALDKALAIKSVHDWVEEELTRLSLCFLSKEDAQEAKKFLFEYKREPWRVFIPYRRTRSWNRSLDGN